MEDIKQIKAKIALKQNTFEYWNTSNDTTRANKTHGDYVPLYGEVCFCEIPESPNNGSNEATNPPTVLFKVGDGETPFKQLNWASALAADVYSWAKKSLDEFTAWVAKTPKTVTLKVNNVDTQYTIEEAIKLVRSEIAAGGSAAALTIADQSEKGKIKYVAQQGGVDIVEAIEIDAGTGINITVGAEDKVPIISHQGAPTAGNKATATPETGEKSTFVTEVIIDGMGHVAGVKTAEIDIPDSPSITITDKTDTDDKDIVYAVTNLVEGGTLNHTITPTYTAVPTKKYVDEEIAAKVAGAVQYLGTVSAAANLGKNESDIEITIGKGDFYRASAAFTLNTEQVHVGDILIAIIDNPGATATNWDVAHLEIDTNTWTANSDTAAGYVAATGGTGNAGKVWKVGADGKPAWLTDTDTDTHHQAKNVVGTSPYATENGQVTGTGGVYLNLVENGAIRSTHNIIGSGAATVKSDANGNITINATDTNTWRGINVFAGVEGNKASVALKGNGITTGPLNLKAGAGLKWTATANTNDATVDIDDTVTFILDCN